VGGVDVSDYLDVIAPACREADVWHALLQHRAGEAAEWDLHAIRAASPTLEILPRLCDAAGIRAQVEREDRCPVLELPASWDAYLERLSGKDRHELRRKIRKLERELPGTSVRSHASPDGWDSALTAFLNLHRLSKAGKARFMDERMEAFFRDATQAWRLRAGRGCGSWSTTEPPWRAFLSRVFGFVQIDWAANWASTLHAKLAPGCSPT
jgi:CelD/BcsL family acetyltransferase involved in cellulose biosynthesis